MLWPCKNKVSGLGVFFASSKKLNEEIERGKDLTTADCTSISSLDLKTPPISYALKKSEINKINIKIRYVIFFVFTIFMSLSHIPKLPSRGLLYNFYYFDTAGIFLHTNIIPVAYRGLFLKTDAHHLTKPLFFIL